MRSLKNIAGFFFPQKERNTQNNVFLDSMVDQHNSLRYSNIKETPPGETCGVHTTYSTNDGYMAATACSRGQDESLNKEISQRDGVRGGRTWQIPDHSTFHADEEKAIMCSFS